MGELDCATCLAFDIDKSPEPGWSPAEVETRHVFGGNLWAHLSSAPDDSLGVFLLLVSLEAIGLAFNTNCAFWGGELNNTNLWSCSRISLIIMHCLGC